MKHIFNSRELAKLLRADIDRVRSWAQKGLLDYAIIDGRYQFDRQALIDRFGVGVLGSPLHTTEEVAQIFAVQPKHVYAWVAAGNLTHIKLPDGTQRVRRSSILQYVSGRLLQRILEAKARVLSQAEFAKKMNMTTQQLVRQPPVEDGPDLPSFQTPGGSWRYLEPDVDLYVAYWYCTTQSGRKK